MDVISSLKPRIPRPLCKGPDYVLYTDAATSTTRIDALLSQGNSLPPVALILAVSRAPTSWIRRFHHKNLIFGLELLAPLAFIWQHRKLLSGEAINLYIDNNNVLTSLVRGDSTNSFIAAMVACFWRIAEAFSIDIWLGRVSSKKNPSDLPTRQAQIPYPVKKRVEFSELFKLLQLTLKWDSFLA